MRYLHFLACVAVFYLCALPCVAQMDFWNGTWKVRANTVAISETPSYTMSRTDQGFYVIDNGSYTYSFRCDGHDYPRFDTTTIACGETATEMDTTIKDKGKIVGTGRWELAHDGQSQEVTGTRFRSDGTKEQTESTYKRIGKSTGFPGAWRKEGIEHQADVILTSLKLGRFHLEIPMVQQYTDMKLDGTDSPIYLHGRASEDATNAIVLESPNRMMVVRKLKGKVVLEGRLILSPDGQTLTYEWWRPPHTEAKTRQLYERQH